MATTSKYAFMLDTVREALKKERTFDVRKVFNVETAMSTNKTAVYVNIISDEARPESLQDNRAYYGLRQCRVGVYAMQQTPVDSNDAGLDAVLHGQIAERIERRIDAILETLPVSDATTAGYTITLHNIEQDRVTGFVSDGSQAVALMYEVLITYVQS
ncbi:MAG TPA: hypothetical protein DCZ59_08590 [Bacteroidetes bacterium]|nr:hypothetical protein [Bacteroidota bacterium]